MTSSVPTRAPGFVLHAGWLCLLLWLSLTLLPARAQTNGTYFLLNANAQAIDVPGSSAADVQLQQYWLNRSPAQQWSLGNATATGYKVVRSLSSGKVLDLSATATGAGIIQRAANSTFDGQQWRFVDVGEGYYKLENKSNGLVVSVRGGTDPATQNQLVSRAYAGTNDQKWRLEQVINTKPTANGTYFLTTASDMAVDVPGSSAADVQLQQYWLNRSPAQQWRLADAASSGYKTLTNQSSGKAADLGTNAAVVQKPASASRAGQQWKLVDVGGGYFKLENKSSGLVLSVTRGTNPATKDKLMVKTYTGTADQKWKLTAAGTSSPPPPSSPPPAAGTGGYTARTNYGARLEPQDKILLGIGQSSDGAFPAFVKAMNDAAVYPNFYMDYVWNLSRDTTDIRVNQIGAAVRRSSQYSDANRYVAVQIGLALNTENQEQNYGAVASGALDHKLQVMLDWIRRMDRPVLLRIGYEFNGHWNNYTDRELYKKAFIHVVQMIRRQGLSKVATVWCAAAYEHNTDYMPYYPGDEYVDWWGLDVFTLGHMSLPMTASFLADARARRKPVIIGESGLKGDALPANGTAAADGAALWKQWYELYFNLIKTNPNIKAISYINYDMKQVFGSDWRDSRVENNATITANFRRELKTGPFAGTLNKSSFFALCDIAATAQSAAVAEPVAAAAATAAEPTAASATVAPEEAGRLSAYPNPSPDGRSTLRLQAQQPQRATVYVHDKHGRLVSLLTVPVQAGQTEFKLLATLPQGTYYLKTRLDGQPQQFTLNVE
ncbi:RICIN domain-containing protein [Hymenobacter weizhouensis]|uniref:RICIN domain-containing protein n=1 Tax=Hymenobacter sp. YIM 151500-1 TaxID=2987689 RepID=UPI00222613E1|nr:RICIN domain-containing protein [Hymenobacter sp. YIM 151500-1]UYZ63629.1 RICIN domain-containing protein [Hymenobacter sp. YIM 151500-1]